MDEGDEGGKEIQIDRKRLTGGNQEDQTAEKAYW